MHDVLTHVPQEDEPLVLAPDAMPLDYMLAVMRDPKADQRRRDRFAIAAAPYVHPKYEALAIAHVQGDLGQRLDAAVRRLEGLPEARAEGRLLEFVRGKEKGAEAPSEKPMRRL